jgi:formylmethanofuran dehydrogenase subunit B
MSRVDPGESGTNRTFLADVVCTSCGCLCDDIELEIEGDRIIEARNACSIGRDRFLGYRAEEGPACLVEGEPAVIEEGIERAARILADARSPLVLGLGETTIEAQRAAVSLAEWIGARVDIGGGVGDRAIVDALQSVGEVTCTLGEIRNRADLIVIWRADPVETHPRLFSRYALDPPGEFIPGGRSDRYCVIVDHRETESVREVADQFIAIKEEGELAALWTVRALVKGVVLDPEAVEAQTGIPLETWQGLIDRIRAARYGVVFYGVGRAETRSAHVVALGIHSLTRDLNATTRFVCQPLSPGSANAVGARNLLSWRTGYPATVSLAEGDSRFGPGEFGADDVLRRQEADAVLVISGDSLPSLGERAQVHLRRISRIVLSSNGEHLFAGAAVLFRTGVFGINTAGTVYRMDGVPLPLRTAIASPSRSDEEVLRAIGRRVRSFTVSTLGLTGRA